MSVSNTILLQFRINQVSIHTHHFPLIVFIDLWAQVLDADVFAAFKESGDIFDAETAAKCRKYIYSSGNTAPPDELFRLFRGRDPEIKFMLEKKGLV